MTEFPKLNFPKYEFKFKDSKIFDPVRKKYVECIPEEWVRQNLIKYLNSEHNYSLSRMRVESKLESADKDYRADLIYYDKNGDPYLVAECKSPDVKLRQKTLDQIGIYNISLKTKYLLITNGLEFLVFEIDHSKKKVTSLEYIPKG